MPKTEERVSDLEKMMKELMYVFTQGQIQHQEFKEEMADFKKEMKISNAKFEKEMADIKNDMKASNAKFEKEISDIKREMKISSDKFEKEMLDIKKDMKASNAQFEKERADIKREMKISSDRYEKEKDEYRNEMNISNDRYEKERDEFRREMSAIKKDIAMTLQKQGTLVEDMIAPSVQEIGERKFGFTPPFLFMVRHKKQKIADLSYIREFDVIAVHNGNVLIVENKSNPKTEYVKEFIDFLKSGELFEYFPEFSEKKIIPIFASIFIPEDVIKYLTKNKIYAMALNGDIMDIVNEIN